jgi:hypothetical protein
MGDYPYSSAAWTITQFFGGMGDYPYSSAAWAIISILRILKTDD